MLAEIFLLRLETSLRDAKQAVKAEKRQFDRVAHVPLASKDSGLIKRAELEGGS